MDKEILKYLDKVGQYLQGAGEKRFETYVHGVFVQSLIYSIVGLVLICITITLTIIAWKYSKIEEKEEATVGMSLLSVLFLIAGIAFLLMNITGIFAPDYVAIKEIAGNIGGK